MPVLHELDRASNDQRAEPAETQEGGGNPLSSFRFARINPTDLWVAAIIMALVALLWTHTTYWEDPSAFAAENIAPTLFPRICLVLIAIMALFLPFEQYLQGERGKALDRDRSAPIRPITYATAALMVAIAASMEWMGSVLVIVLICIVLPLLWGERRMKLLIPYVLLFPPAVIFLFKVLFKVNFEPGILGLGFK